MKIITILLIYTLVAASKYFLNMFRIHQCEDLLDNYIQNHLTNPCDNYALVNSFKRHFRRNNISSEVFSNPKTVTINEAHVTSAYVNKLHEAIGQYKDRQKSSIFWLYYDIFDKLFFINIPSFFKKNILLSALLAVVEWFVFYLATLALDTSGIGQHILDSLHAFLSALWQHIKECQIH